MKTLIFFNPKSNHILGSSFDVNNMMNNNKHFVVYASLLDGVVLCALYLQFIA